MKIVVISLPQAQQRRDRFQSRAADLGLEFDFFDAVQVLSLNGEQPPMTLGEMGCFLSHRRVWQDAAISTEPTVIFEDDAYPYRAIEASDLPPEGWDLVFLNSRISPSDKAFFDNRFRAPVHGCGLEGYAITPQGAEKLLAIAKTVTKPVDLRVIAHCQSFVDAGHPCCTPEFWEPTAPDVRINALKRWPPVVADLDFGHSTIHNGAIA